MSLDQRLRTSEHEPLPPFLLRPVKVDHLVVILGYNVIQELEQFLELFHLPVLFLVELFELLFEFLGDGCFELGESVVRGGIAERPALYTGNFSSL